MTTENHIVVLIIMTILTFLIYMITKTKLETDKKYNCFHYWHNGRIINSELYDKTKTNYELKIQKEEFRRKSLEIIETIKSKYDD